MELARAADAWGYVLTYLASAAVATLALPFLALSLRQPRPPTRRIRPATCEALVSPPDPVLS